MPRNGAAARSQTMTMMRWNPWSEIDTLHAEINKLFDHTAAESRGAQSRGLPSFAPAVDILELTDKFVLKFDLPEVNPNEVDIQVENQTLVVKGERKFEGTDSKNGWHRIERSYGHFSRSFTLPNTVDGDKISATAKDGVLSLTLPKKAETQARKITVAQPD
jgi:HSP20 family protein